MRFGGTLFRLYNELGVKDIGKMVWKTRFVYCPINGLAHGGLKVVFDDTPNLGTVASPQVFWLLQPTVFISYLTFGLCGTEQRRIIKILKKISNNRRDDRLPPSEA
ncbi:uncharacterized protein LOC143354603 [Halictus rubicundus]|uniref:uncharacterized protein LOC143354603 n=1 Tax=Halictus rubicundus TaxID=77578 RepID=UPI0040375502